MLMQFSGIVRAAATNMLRLAAFAADVAAFDAAAFRLARGEAVAMDPQARVLLQQVATARKVRWCACAVPHMPSKPSAWSCVPHSLLLTLYGSVHGSCQKRSSSLAVLQEALAAGALVPPATTGVYVGFVWQVHPCVC